MKQNIPRTPFSTRLSGSAKETELRIRNIFQWRKKRPPVVLVLLAAVVVLLCFGLVSCQTQPEEELPAVDQPEEELPTEDQPEYLPTDAVHDLFNGEGATITLHLSGEGAWNTYTVADDDYAERFEILLSGYRWEMLEMPFTEPSEFWVTVTSLNGEKTMTFWSGTQGMIQYNNGERSTYWKAMQEDEVFGTITENVRKVYDNLEEDSSNIVFGWSGTAEEAADYFVHNAFGYHKKALAPGNMYKITNYAVIDWSVREVSKDGRAVVGWFKYAFIPCDINSPGIWAGNTGQATGEYEGMLDAYREFVLQKQKDGLWHCIELGTGGCMLPETVEKSEEAAILDARSAYAKALEELINDCVLPDGNRAGLTGDMSDNLFAVYDVDGDGREELLLMYTTTYTAGHVGFVLDFDETTQTMRTQFLEYPMLTFYDNGAVKAGLSHNQGWAGRFWPYFLYLYRLDTDSYQSVGMVNAWDKEISDANPGFPPFPSEIDTSGTGFVYYIYNTEDGEYDNVDPVDASVYHAWLENYIGDAREIDIPYLALTAENIQMLRSQQ